MAFLEDFKIGIDDIVALVLIILVILSFVLLPFLAG